MNGFYYLCDAKGLMQQWKLPRTATQAVSPQLFRSTMREAITGALLLQFPASMALYYGMHEFGSDMAAPLPSLFDVYKQVRC